ncbi:MAG: ComEC/Rec2 family competence protein [Candidatus Fimenecus sp.]
MNTQIHFLSTGHSDCILLESNGHFAMIDAAEDTDFPADKPHLNLKGYEDAVCAYLLQNCRNSDGQVVLDFVLGTHCHSDHIGGFDTVIMHPEITVKQAYLKPYYNDNIFIYEAKRWDNQEVYDQMRNALESKNVPIAESFDNVTVTLGDFQIRFLNGTYQKAKHKYGENVNSVVTLVEAYGKRALLAGDMNYKNGGERKIADAVGKVDLLKVGHHGYFGSTSVYWVKKLSPEIAVIPNTMKRVYPDVKWKLKTLAHAEIFATADCGGVIAKFSKETGVTVQTNIMPNL